MVSKIIPSTEKRRPPNAGKGRPKGSLNKATADLRSAAQEYTTASLKTLAGIMENEKQPAAARVSAAIAILDRGHGKPVQAIEASGPDGGPIQTQDQAARAWVEQLTGPERNAIRPILEKAVARQTAASRRSRANGE